MTKAKSIDEAAKELAHLLKSDGCPASVGIAGKTTLIVYLHRIKNDKLFVPDVWHGFVVKARFVGKIYPAASHP